MARVQVSAIACRSTVLLGFWLGSISTGHADLVAHWKLDEGDGEVFADAAAGNDGFLPPGITVEWGEGPPIQENAVRFLGSSSFIATEFPGIGGSSPRTVAFWFRTTDTSAYFLAWGANRTGEKWHIRLNGGNGVIRTEFSGGQNFATRNLLDGEWHHVASVFPEGATEGAELLHYVDGVLDPQAGGNSVLINTAVGDGSADWADGNSTGVISYTSGRSSRTASVGCSMGRWRTYGFTTRRSTRRRSRTSWPREGAWWGARSAVSSTCPAAIR